jgi:hypothetical protein
LATFLTQAFNGSIQPAAMWASSVSAIAAVTIAILQQRDDFTAVHGGASGQEASRASQDSQQSQGETCSLLDGGSGGGAGPSTAVTTSGVRRQDDALC